MVNAPDVIYVEREGRIYPADGRFVDETHLRRVIDKMVGQVGRRIAALVADNQAPSRTAKQKQRRSLFARS